MAQPKLSQKIFNEKMNENVVADTLTWYLASRRRGTHSAKTRAEVRGGGRKPWRQKGTGRARAGSIRSPLWEKGGVIFGPKPRSYKYRLPIKVRKLAQRIVLSDKVVQGKVKIVEELSLAEKKTKLALKLLQDLGVKDKILIVLSKKNEVFNKAARNIRGVKVILFNELNVFDLLNADWLVLEKKAVSSLEEALT
ncbi:MAG: 50S ribosomal protein L4 [Candidatus Saganbacteria bacterium]|nr:50S ribosomal protein L4 [Candidatus Saganbacteria bacterium]